MTKTLFPIIVAAISLQCALAQSPFIENRSLLNKLNSIISSTVPANGDLNPYGVAFVPDGFPPGGTISPGDILVSNFNNSNNVEGTGTTIVSFTPNGAQSLFAISSIIGLDTALGVLSRGWVIVGNVPVVSAGATPGQGAIQVFDKSGTFVTSFSDANLLDSPWDLTINDQGNTAQVFVSNLVSGIVTRLDLSVSKTGVTLNKTTKIGSGFGTELIAQIVGVGPTGLAFDASHDLLYVASTKDNEIFAISSAATRMTDAGMGSLVYSDPVHLHGPLGLTLELNGNLITANGDAINAGGTQNSLVEFTPRGNFVANYQLDGGNPGAAFGVASAFSQGAIRFAAVDDDLNSVTIWALRFEIIINEAVNR